MISKKMKIGIITTGVFSTVAVTTATVVNLSREDNSDDIFVQLDGQTFTSKSKLTEYVKNQADMQTFNTGETAFSINVGQNSLMFSNSTEASSFVQEYFTKSFEAYLKPNYEDYVDPLTGIISGEGYYKSTDIFFNTYKTNNGGYTFALKDDDEANVKAKKEAAESYITMHNAYHFNGIFFDNEVSLERYLKSEITSIDDVSASKVSGFINEAGVNKTFDFNDPTSIEEFKRWVAQSSYPSIVNNEGHTIRLTLENIQEIISFADEEMFSYIPINHNGDTATKIVDISRDTEAGDLYGPYTIQSGSSISSIHDANNWKYENDSPEGFSGHDFEIDQISNLINTMFMEYSSYENILLGFVTDYKPFGKNLFDIIEDIEPQTKKFIRDVSQGQRGTLFNTVHSLYSFVINQLIQTKGSREIIDEFTEYMIEIAEYMDGKALMMIVPFLNGLEEEFADLSFFRRIYSFGEKGFQNNINSFWREIEDDTEYGLSAIRDLLILTTEITNLTTMSVLENDKLIRNHIDNNDFHNTDQLIGNWDMKYYNEVLELKDTRLTNGIGIGNLEVLDIYENIEFVVEHIYHEALTRYFRDMEESISSDPGLTFFVVEESTKQFYLGLGIVSDEEWQNDGTPLDIDENIKHISYSNSDKEKWDDRKDASNIFANVITLLFEEKIWTTKWWKESFKEGDLEEIVPVAFAFFDAVVGTIALFGSVATGGLSIVVYVAIKAVIQGVINILPEVSAIGERENTYSYVDSETGNKWYWDGGIDTWTWFGLGKAESIGKESLRLITTDTVVDGYSMDGYYYNGVIYKSVEGAKERELKDILSDVSYEVKNQNIYDIEREEIVWEVPFKDQEVIFGKTIEEIHILLSDENKRENYFGDIYNIGGKLVDDHNVIIESEIEGWLSTIRPIIIVQNPILLSDGEYLKQEFSLPKPRYTDDGFEADDGTVVNYDIVDINLNIDILSEGVANGTYTQDFMDTLTSLLNMTEGERIDNIFNLYSGQINPNNKLVLFDVMNGQNGNISFDKLTENLKVVKLVEVKFKNGSIHTFIGKINAIDNLLSSDNYSYNVVDISRDYTQYMFNEYVGSTIAMLVDGIIDKQIGGKYA